MSIITPRKVGGVAICVAILFAAAFFLTPAPNEGYRPSNIETTFHQRLSLVASKCGLSELANSSAHRAMISYRSQLNRDLLAGRISCIACTLSDRQAAYEFVPAVSKSMHQTASIRPLLQATELGSPIRVLYFLRNEDAPKLEGVLRSMNIAFTNVVAR